MTRNVRIPVSYAKTDVVILAGGQARRMNGINKLLQKFDNEIQLIKIHQQLKSRAESVWVNSHRDHSIYERIIPSIQFFQDDEAGFQGPLMGMKSAWSYVKSDYVLFVPCDVTYIPKKVISRLHQAFHHHPLSEVAVVEINGKALFPFCLLKRSSLATLDKHLAQNQRSLKHCFADMHMQIASFKNSALFFHSINSFDELQQHQQLSFL
jgi:molybdenum cofactor guanylyltransferase